MKRPVLNPWAIATLACLCFLFVAADSIGPNVPSLFSRIVSTNKTADAWRTALGTGSGTDLTTVSNAQVTTAGNLVTVSNAQITTAANLLTVSNAQITTAANLLSVSNAQITTAGRLVTVSNAQVTTAANLVTVSNAQVTTAGNLVTVSNAQVTTDGKLAGYVTNNAGSATNAALVGGTVTGQTNLDLTASRVMVSDANKVPASSSVTATTLGYLDATSSVQTQLNSKPTVALTNVALLNASQTFSANQTHSGTITVNGTGGDYIVLNGSSGGAPKITLLNSGIGNIEITANASGGLGVNANVSATSFSSSGSFYANSAIGSVNAGGSGGTITAAGVASFWAASGTSPYISFTESGAGYRGVIGYGAGSGDLVVKTGGESFAAATTELFRLTSGGSVGIGTASPSARLHIVGGGLMVGSAGSTVTNYASATATLDFGSIAAQTSADLTITVTGAVANDTVTLGLPTSPTAGVVFNAFVSSANTVTVRANNYTAGAIDPASATYRVGVTSH